MPGHFVVRHRPKREGALTQLVDVFDRGKFISEREAGEIVRVGTGIALTPEHLAPAPKRAIIVRMLRNLIRGAIDNRETERALPYFDLLLVIAPEEPQERLGRAILLFQSGDPIRAKEDIDWLIDTKPPGMEIDRLLEWRASLER